MRMIRVALVALVTLAGVALVGSVAAGSAAAAAEPGVVAPVVSDAAALPYGVGVHPDVQLEERQGYNSEYIFGMSRGLANSTMTPALKPVFFLFTIPLDIAFLPFAAIGGFF